MSECCFLFHFDSVYNVILLGKLVGLFCVCFLGFFFHFYMHIMYAKPSKSRRQSKSIALVLCC